EQGRRLQFPEHNLTDGDEVHLCQPATVVCRVNVVVPARCVQCGTYLPDDRKARCEQTPGVYQCEACRRQAAPAGKPRPLRARSLCGGDVTEQVRGQRHGELVCANCREQPERYLAVPAVRGYTVQEKLAHGGMGAVWLARHDATGRQVALKLMLPQVAADEGAIKRFLLEMTAMGTLNHRNVVRLEDAGYAH